MGGSEHASASRAATMAALLLGTGGCMFPNPRAFDTAEDAGEVVADGGKSVEIPQEDAGEEPEARDAGTMSSPSTDAAISPLADGAVSAAPGQVGCAALRPSVAVPGSTWFCDDFESTDAQALSSAGDGFTCSPASCAGLSVVSETNGNHVLRSRLDAQTVYGASQRGGAVQLARVPASADEIVTELSVFGLPTDAAQSFHFLTLVAADYSLHLQVKWAKSITDANQRCVLRFAKHDGVPGEVDVDGPRYPAPPSGLWTRVRLVLRYDGTRYEAVLSYDGVEQSRVHVEHARASDTLQVMAGLFSEVPGNEAELTLDDLRVSY